MFFETNADFRPLMTALAKAFHKATGYEFHECYSKDAPPVEKAPPINTALTVTTGYYRASIAFLAAPEFSWTAKVSKVPQNREPLMAMALAMRAEMQRELSASGRFGVKVEMDKDYAVYNELKDTRQTVVRVRVPLNVSSEIILMECAFSVFEHRDFID